MINAGMQSDRLVYEDRIECTANGIYPDCVTVPCCPKVRSVERLQLCNYLGRSDEY